MSQNKSEENLILVLAKTLNLYDPKMHQHWTVSQIKKN